MTDEPNAPAPKPTPAIASLIEGLFGGPINDGIHGGTKPPELSDEEKVARLTWAHGRYLNPAPAIGALITPRKDSFYTDVGEPYLVVEQIVPPFRVMHDSPSSNAFYAKLDVRVLCIGRARQGAVVQAFAVESWQFEPWTGES